nr:hypothetical protein [Tanacetum cinerariifolium]
MRVLLLYLIFTLPGELRTSLGVPALFDNRNTTLLQLLNLTVYDLDKFFNEVQFVINLDFIHCLDTALDLNYLLSCLVDDLWVSSLDTALDLNYLLSCLMDDLWVSELSISNLSLTDRLSNLGVDQSSCRSSEVGIDSLQTGAPQGVNLGKSSGITSRSSRTIGTSSSRFNSNLSSAFLDVTCARNLGSQQSRGPSEGYSYPVCTTCGRRHQGECRRAAGTCFKCGQAGHLQKDCRKNTTTSTSGQADKKPGASGCVFTITEGQAANTS